MHAQHQGGNNLLSQSKGDDTPPALGYVNGDRAACDNNILLSEQGRRHPTGVGVREQRMRCVQ